MMTDLPRMVMAAKLNAMNSLLLAGGRVQSRSPLDPGWEAGAAAAAQARRRDLLDHGLGSHQARRLEPRPATAGAVVVETERIDHPDTAESEALLAREEWQGSDVAELIRMSPVQHLLDFVRRDRAVANATLLGFDLNQRFDAEEAAAAGPDHLGAGLGERRGHLIGAERDGGHVAADEDSAHASISAAIASSRARVRRETGRPSTSALGPVAQRPRQ